ncbi:MAG: aminotransferase class V-fold PLP-dependent enzyme [Dehalococcoidia bacterium]|nr:aminotransferase class V-fold PLP-dependent enzyme [Dehalococcoidia bacterium]
MRGVGGVLEFGGTPVEDVYMDVAAVRKLIPATQKSMYLNTGWSGPSPQPVIDAIVNAVRHENEEGPTTPPIAEANRAAKPKVREAYAQFLGVTPEEITLTGNTTHGLNLVLSGMTWREGDELITTDLEHGSGFVPAYNLRARYGINVRIVSLGALDGVDTIVGRLKAAITPRTRVILLSHIMYTTGLLMPLHDINRMAHETGVQVLVDGAQTFGQIPLDLDALECDYYAGPGHKWLLGPEGTGALYVRRDLLPSLQPAAVSSHAALNWDNAGHFEPASGSSEKFELTSSNVPMLLGVIAAIDFLQGIGGMPAVQQRWQGLTERLRQRLSTVPGVAVTSPPTGPTASGLVTFTVAGWEPRPLVTALWDREKVCIRAVPFPAGVRASVDFFNTEDEMDRLAGIVATLAKEGPAA